MFFFWDTWICWAGNVTTLRGKTSETFLRCSCVHFWFTVLFVSSSLFVFFCNTFLQEEACKEERRGQMFMNRLCRTTSRFALIFLRLFSLFGSGVGVLSQNSNRLYFVSKVNLHELRVWMDLAFDLCTTLYFEALVFSESTACVSGHIVMPMSVEYSTEKTDLHLRLARTGMKGICYSPSLWHGPLPLGLWLSCIGAFWGQ